MKQIMKNAVRLFFYLLFSAFASFMLTVSFSVLTKGVNWAFYTFSQICSFIILIILVWQVFYGLGFRNSNMVRTGHQKEDLYKGFKVGAIAQLPWLIFLIAAIALNMRFSIYRIINSTYWTFLTVVCHAFDSQKVVALTMQNVGIMGIVGMFLLLLIVPVISGIVYILGYKGIDLPSRLVYKKYKG